VRHTSTRQRRSSSWTAKIHATDTKKIVIADATRDGHGNREPQGVRLGDGCTHLNGGGLLLGIPNLLLSALVLVLICCQVNADVDVVGGSIFLQGRQEYQGRSTFDLSRVTLAAPKPMPVLESSLALATFFRPARGLFFDLS
jgi:hypothetical protein